MDNPKYFDLLPEVERFVTIDSSCKDLIFNEKFSLGQIVSVKDYDAHTVTKLLWTQ